MESREGRSVRSSDRSSRIAVAHRKSRCLENCGPAWSGASRCPIHPGAEADISIWSVRISLQCEARRRPVRASHRRRMFEPAVRSSARDKNKNAEGKPPPHWGNLKPATASRQRYSRHKRLMRGRSQVARQSITSLSVSTRSRRTSLGVVGTAAISWAARAMPAATTGFFSRSFAIVKS